MAHSAGFEPATARFVAEYSIQLSYECVLTSIEEARILEICMHGVKRNITHKQKSPARDWALDKGL